MSAATDRNAFDVQLFLMARTSHRLRRSGARIRSLSQLLEARPPERKRNQAREKSSNDCAEFDGARMVFFLQANDMQEPAPPRPPLPSPPEVRAEKIIF